MHLPGKYSQFALGGIRLLLDTQRATFDFFIRCSFHYSYGRKTGAKKEMTYLEVVYSYQTPPGEAELRAIDSVREVYGIQRIQFNEKGQNDKLKNAAIQDRGGKLLTVAPKAASNAKAELPMTAYDKRS